MKNYVRVPKNDELYGPLKRVHAEGRTVQIKLSTGESFTAVPVIKPKQEPDPKPYIATIEVQIAVLAETEEEAQQLAYNTLLRRGNEVLRSEDVEIIPMTHCPNGWDGDCVLYSNDDRADAQVTVQEVLDKLKKE